MRILIIAFNIVVMNIINCRRHLLNSSSCSCENRANFTLDVHCDSYNSSKIKVCFATYFNTQTLVFRNSSLRKIPNEIGMLNDLKHVDLSYNEITELDFLNLQYTCTLLEDLSIDFNNITVLRRGNLDCFSNLHVFSITNNGLQTIEFGAFSKKLKHFRYFYAQYNELTSLDSSIVSMLKENSAITANVSYNRISKITNSANLTIANFNKKKRILIEMMHNNITRINVTYYKDIFNITNVIQLYNLWNCAFDIRFNPLICDCSMYQIAQMLRFFRHMDPNNPVFSFTCYMPPVLRGMKVYTVPDTDFNCTIDEKCPPGCICTETVSLPLMTVVCDAYLGKGLPLEVPDFSTVHLSVKDSAIQVLEPRLYLKNVSVLDVSQNKIRNIEPQIIFQLDSIQTVLLSDNLLNYMPQELEKINFTKLSILTLTGNPFKCDCHSLWFKRWLIKHHSHIPNEEKILCPTGYPLTETKDSEFVCTEPFGKNIVFAIAVAIVLFSTLVACIVRSNWTRIQVLLIAKFNIYCFRRKVKTDLKYDIFLSHSSHDDALVYEKILPKLEDSGSGFIVCRNDRDFHVGRTIAYNIISKIDSSLSTLLVISNNFLRSEWCKMEFKQAHMKLLKEKDSSLIMIILGDLDPALMDKELTSYIKTHVYLKFDDKYFWPKLLQALPIREQVSEGSSAPSTSEDVSPCSKDHSVLVRKNSKRHPSEKTSLLSC